MDSSEVKTLTIDEVSKLSGLSKHTLRFWERELEGLIVPLRTKGGQRRYTMTHLLVIEEIKKLKRKNLSLTDINRELNASFDSEEEDYNSNPVDALVNEIGQIVRIAITNFLNVKMNKE